MSSPLSSGTSDTKESDGIFACLLSLACLVLTASFLMGAEDTESKHTRTDAPQLSGDEISAPKPATLPDPQWIELFDGHSLEGWVSTDFGGQGDVYVKEGKLVMELGAYMTGVTYKGNAEIPKTNYEIQMKASRLDGSDFFSGLTFPVKDKFCSLILGGWGGGLCGLSSLDGMDASENQTTTFRLFNAGEYYQIRLLVLDDRILAWIDGERIVDESIVDTEISIRPEVELSCPLGVSTYQTTGALESIHVRKLSDAEIAHWTSAEESTP